MSEETKEEAWAETLVESERNEVAVMQAREGDEPQIEIAQKKVEDVELGEDAYITE